MKCNLKFIIYFLILIFFVKVLKNKLFHNQILNNIKIKNTLEQFGGGSQKRLLNTIILFRLLLVKMILYEVILIDLPIT